MLASELIFSDAFIGVIHRINRGGCLGRVALTVFPLQSFLHELVYCISWSIRRRFQASNIPGTLFFHFSDMIVILHLSKFFLAAVKLGPKR